MDRPLKWTKIRTLLLLLIAVGQVLSDNTRTGDLPTVQTVCPKQFPQTSVNNASPTPQLLNTLLTIAAANGVLPELLPKIQPLGITPPETLTTAQEVPNTVPSSLTQQPTQLYQREPVIAATQPMVSASNANSIIQSQLPTTHTTPTTIVPVQPLVISPGLKQSPQQSNPFIPQISESVQTQPFTYALTQPKEETKTPPTPPEQPNNDIHDEIYEILNPGPMATILTTENGQSFPVNLQITIPPPNMEAPHITFINVPLPPTPIESSTTKVIDQSPHSDWYCYGYAAPAPPQEIIVRKKKSWIKDLLPIILFSLINNDRKHCNNDGCCCCSCNSGRRNTPVPFPIPIPTNNPIINTGYSNLSRKRGHKRIDDDEYDCLVGLHE